MDEEPKLSSKTCHMVYSPAVTPASVVWARLLKNFEKAVFDWDRWDAPLLLTAARLESSELRRYVTGHQAANMLVSVRPALLEAWPSHPGSNWVRAGYSARHEHSAALMVARLIFVLSGASSMRC